MQGWGLRSLRSVGALLKVLGFMVVTVGQAAFSCGYLSIIRHHRDGSSGGARRGGGGSSPPIVANFTEHPRAPPRIFTMVALRRRG